MCDLAKPRSKQAVEYKMNFSHTAMIHKNTPDFLVVILKILVSWQWEKLPLQARYIFLVTLQNFNKQYFP